MGKGGKHWQKGNDYGKGGGKGGKGPIGGCWVCGGRHYASACPKGGGKGKGKLSWVGGDQESEWWGSGESEDGSKYLSSLVSIPTKNRWSVLERADTEEKEDATVIFDAASSSDGGSVVSGAALSASVASSNAGISRSVPKAAADASVASSNAGIPASACDLKDLPAQSSDGASSAERWSDVVRSGRKRLAQQENVPAPCAISGTDILMSAKRKERQGERKKQFAHQKMGCTEKCCHSAGQINILETMMPASLNAVRSDGWESIEMAVDSGASETVIGEDMVATATLTESEGSRRGVEYKVANGESLPNLGEKRFEAVTGENVNRKIKAQVCSVQQGLLSVKKMVDTGHKVVFASEGSYIEDRRTFERMHLTEKNGMFFLKLWTKSPKTGF